MAPGGRRATHAHLASCWCQGDLKWPGIQDAPRVAREVPALGAPPRQSVLGGDSHHWRWGGSARAGAAATYVLFVSTPPYARAVAGSPLHRNSRVASRLRARARRPCPRRPRRDATTPCSNPCRPCPLSRSRQLQRVGGKLEVALHCRPCRLVAGAPRSSGPIAVINSCCDHTDLEVGQREVKPPAIKRLS